MATTYVVITDDAHGSTLTEYDQPLPYQRIKEHIDGWIEAVNNPLGLTVYADEEGKLKRLPSNRVGESVIGWSYEFDIVCGPLVITGDVDDEGETQPLTAEQVESIRARYQGALRLNGRQAPEPVEA